MCLALRGGFAVLHGSALALDFAQRVIKTMNRNAIRAKQNRSKAFTPLRGASYFCLGKSSQNRQRLTLAAALRPCPAAVLGSL